MGEGTWEVAFDDERVVVRPPRDESREALWANLSRVAILTTDEGPWSADFHWMLHVDGSAGPRLMFPNDAAGIQEFLHELGRRFTDVRWDQIVEASGSTANAYFVVWRSAADPEVNPPEPSPKARRVRGFFRRFFGGEAV